MSSGKFYWIKLKRDFFKRHDIHILSKMPHGNDIILFYLKLLLESTDHEGELRFSEDVPYSVDMLAAITDTDAEIAKQAVDILSKLKLFEYKTDGTIALTKFNDMVGSETQWAEKKRTYRGQLEDTKRTTRGQKRTMSDKSIEIRDKSIEIRDKSIDFFSSEKNADFTPPTIEELCEYCDSRHNGINPQNFYDYYSAKGWCIGSGGQMKDWRAAIRAWENNKKNYEGDAI